MQHRSPTARVLLAASAIALALPVVATAQKTDKPVSKPVLTQTKPTPDDKRPHELGVVDVKAPMGDDSLKFDPLVRRGTLANGMRYYVRRNARPEKRAELRLALNAGALLESEDQRGLAHFTEHMAFNGTRRFEKSEIVNFLERIGMSFGADLNAYTAFDETVYMLTVPTDSTAAFRKSFQILSDWATGLTFDSAEVNKERGVVIEEWRSRRGAQARVQDQQLPVLLQGSRYAERLPIGTPEGLQSFKQASLRQFYKSWYKPDLMAVVAVGDFNPDTVVALIKREFASIKAPAQKTSRPTYPVPGNDTTLFSVATDKELTSSNVQILWKLPKRTEGTAAEYRTQLIEQLADGMLNERFTELTQKPDAPFLGAGAGSAGFVRSTDIYLLGANVKEGGIVKGLEGILTEAERASRFGFTAGELAREKADMLRNYERAYAEREKSNSASYAGEYVNAFLEREPAPGIAVEWALVQRDLPGITLEEVNAVAKSRLKDRDRVVLASAPDKPGLVAPTPAELKAAFDRVSRSQQIVAYVDNAATGALVETPPTPGRVTATKQYPSLGVTEWTLSNGARVLLKPTDFKADEVQFAAQSAGGASLVADRDVVHADLSSVVMSVSGVGSFNQVALGKKLTGKRVGVGATVGESSQSLRGSASARDIETLFQLAWLRMTQPRVDSSAFLAFKNQMKAVMANQRNTPQAVFEDTISVTMAQHHPRLHLIAPELLDSVDIARSLAIYRERFADASGFTFFLVGSFRPDSVRPLVERYLASLPSLNRNEKARDVGIRPPTGVVERTVRRGVEAKAQTQLVFTGSCEYSYENRIVMDALRDLLDIRLREALREDKGGTYGVNVGGGCRNIPTQRYEFSVSFGSAPERTDELVKEVFAVIDSVKAGVVSDSNLVKIKEMPIRGHETSLKQNGAWIAAMADADEDGRDQRDFTRLPELVNAVTKEKLRDAARLYLRKDQYARFTLLPESKSK